ncbi:MAG: hypothetical protein E7350_01845 [Clostridiales bacterium]|nr:hypothetical protein [Clostridiales bacterium]
MKSRKLFLAMIIAVIVSLGLMTVACDRKNPDDNGPREEGPETGIYYCDTAAGESLLTLNSGDKFTLIIGNQSKSGTYVLEQATDGYTVTFTFNNSADGTVSGQMVGGAIGFTYNGSRMIFRKRVSFTVSFDSQGGSEVQSVSVQNGRTLSKPADPVKEGNLFYGWYKDAAGATPYTFGAEMVTAATTLYAKWIPVEIGVQNFTVDFELGYEGAENIEKATTVNGKLYNVATPEREGYLFGGWWISDSDNGEKLTRIYGENTVFVEDTTLYAVWNESSTEIMPSVTDKAIEWQGLTGVSDYIVKIYDAENNEVHSSNASDTSYDPEWDTFEGGEYKVVVSAGNNVGHTRYFNNKTLNKASKFTVVGNILVFGAVENAEEYFITIDCGNEYHNHDMLSNGKSTSYNFSACPVKEGGVIEFTVHARATGYVDSVSRAYRLDRSLDEISAVVNNANTETVSWDRVENASSYEVLVWLNESTVYTYNVGNAASFCYKHLNAGSATISVRPISEGYYSPSPKGITIEKQTLATPTGLKIVGSTVSWNEVQGANGYELNVDGEIVSVSGTSHDISEQLDGIGEYADFTITVAAKGAHNSLHSDVLNVNNGKMHNVIRYYGNTVSWKSVVGAQRFEVLVNDEVAVESTTEASAVISLTKAGYNKITVNCFFNDYDEPETVDMEVYAYTVTFNHGGESTEAYVAVGDAIEYPTEPTMEGYTFEGWYDVIGGAASNGKRMEDIVLTEGRDISLYSYMIPQNVLVTLVYPDNENTDDSATSAEVVFGQEYTLPVPTNKDATKVFIAWVTENGERSSAVTDAYGVSSDIWSRSEVDEDGEIKLYPFWTTALSFGETGNTYSVSKKSGIQKVDKLTIPATYNGKYVTTISDFSNCPYLTELNIPNTISVINTSAFQGCPSLASINVYHVSGGRPGGFSSVNGTLIQTLETGEREIAFIAEGTKGAFTVPGFITTITNVFAGSNITQVTIPANVSAITKDAFAGCTQLRKVIFEDRRTPIVIEEGAFANCVRLSDIKLPNTFALASGVSFYQVFMGSGVQRIDIMTGHSTYRSNDGLVTLIRANTLVYYPAGRGNTSLPGNIQTIADYAFYGNTTITKVELPTYTVSVGRYSFSACPALEEVVAGENLKAIGDYAFYGCSSLKTVDFSQNSSLESIGKYAFAQEEGLIFYESHTNTTLTNVMLPSSVKTIAEGAFYECRNAIIDLNIPNATSIGDKAFTSCFSLERADLSSIDTIGLDAFNKCYALGYVVIGDFSSIGSNAFGSCVMLYEVVNLSSTTITAGESANGLIAQNALSVVTSLEDSNMHTEGDFTYFLQNNSATIVNYSGTDTTVEIPSTLGGVSNIKIAAGAFRGCDFIEKVIIPSSVSSISGGTSHVGDSYNPSAWSAYPSFFDCINLKEVVNLSSLNISAGNTGNGYVGYYAAKVYKSADAQSELYDIDGNLFTYTLSGIEDGVPKITNVKYVGTRGNGNTVVLPDMFTYEYEDNLYEFPYSLDVKAFVGKSIENLTIGGVSSIPGYLFGSSGNTTLKTLVVNGTGNTIISDYAFYLCTALQSVKVTGVSSIGQQSFGGEGMPSTGQVHKEMYIRSVSFDDSLKTIGYAAFFANVLLESAELGKGLTTLSNGAFGACYSLKSITIPASMGQSTDFGNNSNGTSTEQVYKRGNLAFYKCSSLETVVIEDGVKRLPNSIFADCSSLANVTLSNTLESLGEKTFSGCAIRELVLPDTLTTIGSEAFLNNRKLSYLVVGSSLKTAQVAAAKFRGCYGLREIYNRSSASIKVGSGIAQYAYVVYTDESQRLVRTETEDGWLFCEYNGVAYLDGYNGNETVVVTPASYNGGTYEIGNYAFYASSFVSVTLSKNVTAIGNYAFNYGINDSDAHLSDIHLNEGLTKIGTYAFGGQLLSSIEIPSTVTSIGANAFNGCVLMVEAWIGVGEGSMSILNNAFYNCSSLNFVVFGEAVSSVMGTPFGECKSLDRIFYLGDKAAWTSLSVMIPTISTVYYYSESAPTEAGSYWHYEYGIPKIWA